MNSKFHKWYKVVITRFYEPDFHTGTYKKHATKCWQEEAEFQLLEEAMDFLVRRSAMIPNYTLTIVETWKYINE